MLYALAAQNYARKNPPRPIREANRYGRTVSRHLTLPGVRGEGRNRYPGIRGEERNSVRRSQGRKRQFFCSFPPTPRHEAIGGMLRVGVQNTMPVATNANMNMTCTQFQRFNEQRQGSVLSPTVLFVVMDEILLYFLMFHSSYISSLKTFFAIIPTQPKNDCVFTA